MPSIYLIIKGFLLMGVLLIITAFLFTLNDLKENNTDENKKNLVILAIGCLVLLVAAISI